MWQAIKDQLIYLLGGFTGKEYLELKEEVEDWIAEKISADTGFCHLGFDYRVFD